MSGIRAQIEILCDRMLGELGGVVSYVGGPVPHVDMLRRCFSFETGFRIRRDSRAQIMLGFLMRHLGPRLWSRYTRTVSCKQTFVYQRARRCDARRLGDHSGSLP
jgi:hypothetical protein